MAETVTHMVKGVAKHYGGVAMLIVFGVIVAAFAWFYVIPFLKGKSKTADKLLGGGGGSPAAGSDADDVNAALHGA